MSRDKLKEHLFRTGGKRTKGQDSKFTYNGVQGRTQKRNKHELGSGRRWHLYKVHVGEGPLKKYKPARLGSIGPCEKRGRGRS